MEMMAPASTPVEVPCHNMMAWFRVVALSSCYILNIYVGKCGYMHIHFTIDISKTFILKHLMSNVFPWPC